ncbi:MAG TPA: hypothetical protein DCQ04_13285 [Actinobacteria bacterium]|nr:hypothetical protein [Actinomycetota bacterium]
MSTTLDARLAALKDGDTVRWLSTYRNDFVGIYKAHHGLDVAVVADGRVTMSVIHAQQIIWPETPRAKPGVVYRSRGWCQGVGLANGRVWNVSNGCLADFDSSLWIEVPDEQEGR